jgi:hypothetical protein
MSPDLRKSLQEIVDLAKKKKGKLDDKTLDAALKKLNIDYDTLGENWDYFVKLLRKSGIELADDLKKSNIVNTVLKEAKWIESANNLVVENDFDLSVTNKDEKPVNIPTGGKIQLIRRNPNYVTIKWEGKELYVGDWNTSSKFDAKQKVLPFRPIVVDLEKD